MIWFWCWRPRFECLLGCIFWTFLFFSQWITWWVYVMLTLSREDYMRFKVNKICIRNISIFQYFNIYKSIICIFLRYVHNVNPLRCASVATKNMARVLNVLVRCGADVTLSSWSGTGLMSMPRKFTARHLLTMLCYSGTRLWHGCTETPGQGLVSWSEWEAQCFPVKLNSDVWGCDPHHRTALVGIEQLFNTAGNYSSLKQATWVMG